MNILTLESWKCFLFDSDYDSYYEVHDMGDTSDGRAREWTFLVYPGYCKENWKQLLDGLHIQWCCSPLHHGYKQEDGPERKDHYHVLLYFRGKKSLDQVQRISNLTHLYNQGVKPFRVLSDRGLLRYFLHLDNPEKEQFAETVQVEVHGGVKLDPTIFEPCQMSVDVALFQMREFVQKNNISEFKLLYDYAAKYRRSTWFYYLNHTCSQVMKLYLNSTRHCKRDLKGRVVDQYSGEVIDIDNFVE